MKVFLAGATGAIGRRLVPLLVDAGHDVVGSTRTPAKAESLRLAGVRGVVLEGHDGDAIMRSVADARPDVVIHQMTALGGELDLRRFARTFAETNRLRTEGTDHLLAAAIEAGAKRFIVQSFTGLPNEQTGGPVKTEDDPLIADPPEAVRETVDAIKHIEAVTLAARDLDALALRYGGLYGPGTSLGKSGAMLEAIAKRKMPLVGAAGGVNSFIHVDDAAAATALAVERGAPGLYNVVDDDPAPVSEWLPYLAELIGAKPPRRVPVWLAKLVVGEPGVSMMTTIRGSSNAKAKRELSWELKYPSWRQGFREAL